MATRAQSFGRRARCASALLHVGLLIAFFVASALSPEPWPEPTVVAAPPGLVFFDAGAAPRRPALAPSGLARPRPGGLQAPSSRQTAPSASTALPLTPTSPIDDLTAAGDGPIGGDRPGCTSGCVVGPGHFGDGPGEGGGEGNGPTVVRPGGHLKAPLKVRDVPPEYPDLARRARIDGAVKIDCRIDETGRVVDATVVYGSPLLSQAALVAVRGWRYTPTLLNGVPVQVVMTVTVHFHLHRGREISTWP